MAKNIIESRSSINYLNDCVQIILNHADRNLLECLNQSYFDEIENRAHLILAQWYSEQIIDEESSAYIKNVGCINGKIAVLPTKFKLNDTQYERIKYLIFNAETIELIKAIIQSITETNSRHEDYFISSLSTFVNVYSIMKHSKLQFNEVTKQALQSTYYKKYLDDLLSSKIEPIHLFFVGTIGQLAMPSEHSKFQKDYLNFFTKSYCKRYFLNDIDLDYCTLGILSQLDSSILVNDYSCISILKEIFVDASPQLTKPNKKAFLLPILNKLNSLCIRSKTIACFLNTDDFVDVLLQYVTMKKDSKINTNACLLLGHIISEKQLSQLRITYRLTMKLITLLYNYHDETNNILYSLLSLVIHERVQYTVAETYQLKNFIRFCEQHPIMYDVIWKLSFHPEILQQLIIRHDDFLTTLSSRSNLSAANGILQNIQMKGLSPLPSKDEIFFDVAIISSPNDKSNVKNIEEQLEKCQLHIGTVRNSSSVIFCISEDAKHDCACQTAVRQAELACRKIILCIVQESYRLDDWLKMLQIDQNQETNVFFNMNNLDINRMVSTIERVQRFNQLLPNISKNTRTIKKSKITSNISARSSSPKRLTFETIPPVSQPSTSRQVKKVQDWTNQEVLQWCINHNLSPFTKILSLYDGRSLLALAHVSRMSSPHTIINQLRNDCRKHGLNLSFVEFVRFQGALDELSRPERTPAGATSISTLATRYVYQRKNQ